MVRVRLERGNRVRRVEKRAGGRGWFRELGEKGELSSLGSRVVFGV